MIYVRLVLYFGTLFSSKFGNYLPEEEGLVVMSIAFLLTYIDGLSVPPFMVMAGL